MAMTGTPSLSEIITLSETRDDACVSVYFPSSPLSTDSDRMRLEFKNAITHAVRKLESTKIEPARIDSLRESLQRLENDREFTQNQAPGMAIFATPDFQQVFSLPNRFEQKTTVGDRFDIGALLRSVTFANAGFVLALAEGSIRLVELSAENPAVEHPLDLPADLHTVLEYTSNHGQADQARAQGTTGEKVEYRRFSRIVEEAVLAVIGDRGVPLILAATQDLDPAYRAVNTYNLLLEDGIDVNPQSLDVAELEARAREVLDAHYAAQLERWREDFGTHLSNGRATSGFAEVARAASAGAVAELLFNMDDDTQGTIGADGAVEQAAAPGPDSYGLVDEIAIRVLRAGGTVRAVREEDLVDRSPVVALLRYPLEGVPGL